MYQNNYEPTISERIFQVVSQLLALFVSVCLSAFMTGFRGLIVVVIGIFGAFIIYLCIGIWLLVVSMSIRLDYWKNTSVWSFIFSGIWQLIFSAIFILSFYDYEKDGLDKEKRIAVVFLSVLCVSYLIILEFILVQGFNCLIVCLYYNIGYTYPIKKDELLSHLIHHRQNIGEIEGDRSAIQNSYQNSDEI
jgi:hypothetical protein